MRLHFQEEPWDLFLAIGYTMLLSFAIVLSGTGNLLAILLLLFAPGYVLVAALFPSSRELDWIERIALSVGLSIVLVPLLGLLLNYTPFRIRLVPLVATIALFTTLVGLAAYWRRMRLPAEARVAATITIPFSDQQESSILDKALVVALAASIGTAALAFTYVLLTPAPKERLTEFYLVDPGGAVLSSPLRLNLSEPATVVVGVANHEGAAVSYTVRADLVGVEILYNSSSGRNETIERNRTMLSTFNFTVEDEQNGTYPFTFRIDSVGTWKVEFLLFKDDDRLTVYRSVHLLVSVEAE